MQNEEAVGQEKRQWLTVEEMAGRLDVTTSRVKHMIKAGQLPSARKASSHEAVLLLEAKRVKTIPHAGVLVIQEDDVALVEQRSRKGGRPRKERAETGDIQERLPGWEERKGRVKRSFLFPRCQPRSPGPAHGLSASGLDREPR